MRVRVYRNRTRHCWSIQKHYPHVGWRLWAHSNSVELKNCTFKVSDASRRRCLETGKRNVHAVIEGELVNLDFSIGRGFNHTSFYYDVNLGVFIDAFNLVSIARADSVVLWNKSTVYNNATQET